MPSGCTHISGLGIGLPPVLHQSISPSVGSSLIICQLPAATVEYVTVPEESRYCHTSVHEPEEVPLRVSVIEPPTIDSVPADTGSAWPPTSVR